MVASADLSDFISPPSALRSSHVLSAQPPRLPLSTSRAMAIWGPADIQQHRRVQPPSCVCTPLHTGRAERACAAITSNLSARPQSGRQDELGAKRTYGWVVGRSFRRGSWGKRVDVLSTLAVVIAAVTDTLTIAPDVTTASGSTSSSSWWLPRLQGPPLSRLPASATRSESLEAPSKRLTLEAEQARGGTLVSLGSLRAGRNRPYARQNGPPFRCD